MFGRRKKDERAANRLTTQAEPNRLAWAPSGVAPAGWAAPADQDEADDELTKAYGPNGHAVADLLDRLESMDFDQAERLTAAFVAIPDAEIKTAREAVGRCSGGRRSPNLQLSRADVGVRKWVLARPDADEDPAGVFYIAEDAALAAVQALVLGDKLDEASSSTLYSAWDQVMNAAPSAEAESVESADLGPNSDLVEEFLTRLAAVTGAETLALIEAWDGQSPEDQVRARANIRALYDQDADCRDQIDHTQDQVFAWMNGRNRRYDFSIGWNPSLGNDRAAALQAVAGAADALAVVDMLRPEDAETLYAAWAEAIGEPSLPVFEDDGDLT